MATKGDSFVLKNLLPQVPVNTIETLKEVLYEIRYDLEDNYYQNPDCRLDTNRQVLENFSSLELEQLKRYYFEKSTFAHLFDCFLREEYVSAEVIASECDLSISQYYRLCKQLNRRLTPFGIEISGRQLIGEEHIIRFVASDLYAQYLTPDSSWFNGNYQYCETQVKTMLEDLVTTYSGVNLHWMTCQFYVAKLRLKYDHFIPSKANVFLRRYTDNPDDVGDKLYRELGRKFQNISSTQTVLKLTPDRLKNEVAYLLHVIPLGGLTFAFDIRSILQTDIDNKITQISDEIDKLFVENARPHMSSMLKRQLIHELLPLILIIVAFPSSLKKEGEKESRFELLDFYPVGGLIATVLFKKTLNILLPGRDNIDNRRYWFSELSTEFVSAIVANLHYSELLPTIKVAFEFSHALTISTLMQSLMTKITEVEFEFVTDVKEADVLFTNMVNAEIDCDHRLNFVFNQFPTYEEWSAMKAKIVTYSTHKYFEDCQLEDDLQIV
jgi:hypothetical protein